MSELFIVGAQRSGTTYLYNLLDEHTQIHMAKPLRPEPKFFLNKSEWAKGKDYYESLYYGDRSKEHKYLGEKSTSYIEQKIVAKRIRSYYLDARILIILRDPVDRTYSYYRCSVQNGIISLTFVNALPADSERLSNAQYNSSVNPYAYQQRSHYINYLQSYSEVFDQSQIYIIIFEEFKSDIKAISNLYSWLGIDESCVSHGHNKKVNESKISCLNQVELAEIKAALYEQFADSNARLEEYLNRNIDVWRHK